MKAQKLDSKIYRFIKDCRIAVLVFGTAILFYACENDIEKIKAFSSTENLPILEAVDFETAFSDSGQIRYLLKTPKLLRFENKGKEFHEFPVGMQIIQYDAEHNVVSTLTADYAKQYLKEQKWEAKNNVVATNEEGDTLKTELLFWEQGTEKIYTEEFVKIIREDGIWTGTGLESDQSLRDWKITKMKGVIYFDENEVKENKPQTENPTTKNTIIKRPSKGPLQFND